MIYNLNKCLILETVFFYIHLQGKKQIVKVYFLSTITQIFIKIYVNQSMFDNYLSLRLTKILIFFSK